MSIGLTTVILFAVFGILLFLSCPISVSIVIASIVAAMSSLSWDQITFITMQKMNSGVESFSLLAIPLFILAGNIMNNGGIARRLVNFAKLFVGWIPGSLAQANIVGNMLFGALSGSSVAAASAMGGCIYPIQKDEAMIRHLPPLSILHLPHRTSDSADQRIYRIFYRSRRRVYFRLVYGRLHTGDPDGSGYYGGCIYLCKKAQIPYFRTCANEGRFKDYL